MPTYIRGKTPVHAWRRLVKKIMKDGLIRTDERDLQTKWLDNVLIHIENPYENRVSAGYPFSEKVLKEQYATQLLTPDKLDFEYTYGERLNAWGKEQINQIDYIVKKLSSSPHTRRAVANLWDPRVDERADEVPCLNHFVFMKKKDMLDLTVAIRSNDMFGAWPANVYALTELLIHVSERVKMKPGSITTLSVNAHIYQHDWEKAELI